MQTKGKIATASLITLGVLAATATSSYALPRRVKPMKPGPACTATYTTDVKIKGTGERNTKSGINRNGPIEYNSEKLLRRVDTGAPTAVVTTCKNATTGKWEVLSATFQNHYYDLTVTESPNGVTVVPRTDSPWGGYGVFARGITKDSIVVEGKRCIRKSDRAWLGTMHEVLGLPIPAPLPYSVGAWVADKMLPHPTDSGMHCADLGTAEMPFTIASDGEVKLEQRRWAAGMKYIEVYNDRDRVGAGQPYRFGGEEDWIFVEPA